MTTTTPSPSSNELRPSSQRPRSNRRVAIRWIKRGVIAILAIGIVAAIALALVPQPVGVDVAVVTRAPLEVEIAEDGRTRVCDRYTVAAPIAGDLVRISLDAGAEVTEGQVIATIQPMVPQLLDARSRDEARARLAGAEAQRRAAIAARDRARAARDLAVHDADRARQLVERGAITRSEYERADVAAQLAARDVVAAEAQRGAADAQIAAARAVLDGHVRSDVTGVPVLAPASGRVLRVVHDSAGPVAAGTPLLEIGDPSALEVVIDVLSTDAVKILPGMPVELERWGGEERLSARVERIEPSAFTRVSALGVEEQRVRVIAGFVGTHGALGDGYAMAARIITWRADGVLVVPTSAVFRDRGAWAVFVVDDGRARVVPVTVGHRGRLAVEVTGLGEGTRVVEHPSDRVRDGVRVSSR